MPEVSRPTSRSNRGVFLPAKKDSGDHKRLGSQQFVKLGGDSARGPISRQLRISVWCLIAKDEVYGEAIAEEITRTSYGQFEGCA